VLGSRIKLNKELYRKVKMYADMSGYSTVEEFVHHTLEKEVQQLEEAGSVDEVKKRLKGLGYIS
jgi:hypothetical protein